MASQLVTKIIATVTARTPKRKSLGEAKLSSPVTVQRQCKSLLDDGKPCLEPAIAANEFCEQHAHWFTADLEIFKMVNEHYRQDLREFWTRSNFYLLAQAGLLTVFISTFGSPTNRTPPPSQAVQIALIAVGVLLSILWLFVARWSLYWIQQWRKQVIEVDKAVDRFRCYVKVETLVIRSPLKNPSIFTEALPVIFGLAWLSLFVLLIYHL